MRRPSPAHSRSVSADFSPFRPPASQTMKARIAASAIAFLALAAPIEAQSRTRHTTQTSTHIVEDHDGRRVEVRVQGDVTFNDAGDWVTAVAPGASLRIEESVGGDDRRIEFRRDDGGGVRMQYWNEGRERAVDAQTRAWAQRRIREAVRESAIGARTRVPRIRERHGVQGVLSEIARINNDTGKRLYYIALLDGDPLSAAEFDLVMADVGRRIQSDTETRLVLMEALG